MKYFVALLIVLLHSSITQAQDRLSTAIPKLAPGPHMGIIAGFDPLDNKPPYRLRRSEELTKEAIYSGATINRIQIDWSELEPQKGKYDEDQLNEFFDNIKDQNLSTIVTLSTLDSDGFTLPSYLMNDKRQLKDDLKLNSPSLIKDFENLLAWLTPKLREKNVWALSLGNEVDSTMVDNNIAENSALDFFISGKNTVKQIDPQMAVSVTLTTKSYVNFPDFTKKLISKLDFATFNYYCLDDYFKVSKKSKWEKDLKRMKKEAAEKEIFFQELGCPAGYEDSDKESYVVGSIEKQNKFFAFFIDKIIQDPQLRGATIFQLFDWSPQTIRLLTDPIRNEGLPEVANIVDEWHETLGLCRWKDTTCRPAWNIWLNGLKKIKSGAP